MNLALKLVSKVRKQNSETLKPILALEPPKRKRPAMLAYDVDETPPLSLCLSLSLQHVLAMSVGWIYVVVGVNSMGGTLVQSESLIRMSMIASGLATILQATQGRFGSGYFCPASCSLTYLAPSILAGRLGGLPLVFGRRLFRAR